MPTRLSLFGLKVQDSPTERVRVLAGSAAVLALLVVLEWSFRLDVSLGILYTFPVAMAAVVLTRWQVVLAAVVCAVVRGQFTVTASGLESLLRFLMATIASAGAGLLVVEVSSNRRRLAEHYARLDLEQRLRRKAEEQLRILVQSSPAGILTLDAEANVVAANRAAHEMFGCEPGSLNGAPITPYFPVFQRALSFHRAGGRCDHRYQAGRGARRDLRFRYRPGFRRTAWARTTRWRRFWWTCRRRFATGSGRTSGSWWTITGCWRERFPMRSGTCVRRRRWFVRIWRDQRICREARILRRCGTW